MRTAILITTVLTFLVFTTTLAAAVTLDQSTFETAGGSDGWTSVLYVVGTLGNGAMAQTAGVGNPGGAMRFSGNGNTDNNYGGTREGVKFYKAISTVGYEDITVSFDVKFTSYGNAWPATSRPADDKPLLLHRELTGDGLGLLEEQLVIYYMTTPGTWVEAAWWSRNSNTGLTNWAGTLPTSYATRSVSLAAVPAANNNSDFQLMFQWQVNNSGDVGLLDNIVVQGSAIPEPSSLLALSAFGIGVFGFIRRRRA